MKGKVSTAEGQISTLESKVAALESFNKNGLEIVKEFFYTNGNDLTLATKDVYYCWDKFVVEVNETLDFSAMAEIISVYENINFNLYLFKNGVTVAETGVYDKDVIEAGIIFYKGRVTGSSANFRFCIKS